MAVRTSAEDRPRAAFDDVALQSRRPRSDCRSAQTLSPSDDLLSRLAVVGG